MPKKLTIRLVGAREDILVRNMPDEDARYLRHGLMETKPGWTDIVLPKSTISVQRTNISAVIEEDEE